MDNIFRFIDFDFKHKWQSIFWNIVILSVLGATLLGVGEIVRSWESIPKFITESPEAIRVATFFLWLILSFGLVKLGWEKYQDERLLVKNEAYNFKSSHWPSKWIFNGKTEITTGIDELFVKSSRAGCLLRTHMWKDFKMTFEMKFVDNLMKNVAIVFRAEDLDNYLMLEIFREDRGSSDGKAIWKSGIKPHVRFKGGWEIVYPENYNDLDFSDFTQIVIEVKGDVVKLFYRQKPKFTWVLPTHVDVNHIEAGFKENKDGGDDKDMKIIGRETIGFVQEIPFRCNYGMVGFRAHPGQGAIIRGLTVEPL